MADPDAAGPSRDEFIWEIEAAIREAGYQGAFTHDGAQGLSTETPGGLSVSV